MFDGPTLAIDAWTWTIAKGVFVGQLLLIGLGLLVFLLGPWLYDRVRRWRRRGAVSARMILLIAAGVLLVTKAASRLGDLFGGGPPTIVQHVDPASIEKARVDPTPGLLERVQLGRVRPSQVRIGTAPSAAGKQRVADYCGPTASAQTSAKPVATKGLQQANDVATAESRLLPDFNGKVNGSKAFLSSTLNDGTPWDATYKVRGRWTFTSSGDSVLVTSERFWSRFARGLVRCGVVASAGAGIGYLADRKQPLQGAARGAAIGGGTCAVLEIAF